ncbi:polymerase delta-interacting protein 3-like isoform X2 [Danaus plexippus]|uniref:polymerase delta-interacting protein 3-like isoform X2 n=1 Tax=Danaus plexippus TaxID=13037 RepID=UPI002AB08751|nr:polymerase delta-interacting protein 3-like isoform X2 [Danaus plexippus]
MASYVNMSLDDIIQKQKKDSVRNTFKNKKQLPVKKKTIMDARNKIISKKRTQITDAREKLGELAKQKDARLRLEQLRAKRAVTKMQGGFISHKHGRPNKQFAMKERVFTDPSRQVAYQSLTPKFVKKNVFNKRFVGERPNEPRNFADVKCSYKPIIRTVENDIAIIDDPLEKMCEPIGTSLTNRKASLQLKIVTHNSDAHRTATIEKEKSPPRPPSILKKRPMAALRTENKVEKPEKSNHEYRIIVSNLRNTVTGGDIEELFGDVGGMVESRLVRPGTAEVIYKTVQDAQKAVELYHNRQLDGQPMTCLLVTPRPNTVMRNTGKPALYSTNSNVVPDISTFHKVLFSSF